MSNITKFVKNLATFVTMDTKVDHEVQGEPKIKPLYFKAKDVPSQLTTLEICREAERIAGVGQLEGAQIIRGLWRIYFKSEEAREKLQLEGISLKGVSVELYATNPFLQPQTDGQYVEVHDMPLSYDNNEIARWLNTHGFQAASEIKHKYARDENNKLTSFKTGSRFLYVKGDISKLPRKVQIGLFTVSLWSSAQERVIRDPKCTNCLENGHMKRECKNAMVCFSCKQPGHKKGECTITTHDEVLDSGTHDEVLDSRTQDEAAQLLSMVNPSADPDAKILQQVTAMLREARELPQPSSTSSPFIRGRRLTRGARGMGVSANGRHSSRKREQPDTSREEMSSKKKDERRTPVAEHKPSDRDEESPPDHTSDEESSDEDPPLQPSNTEDTEA